MDQPLRPQKDSQVMRHGMLASSLLMAVSFSLVWFFGSQKSRISLTTTEAALDVGMAMQDSSDTDEGSYSDEKVMGADVPKDYTSDALPREGSVTELARFDAESGVYLEHQVGRSDDREIPGVFAPEYVDRARDGCVVTGCGNHLCREEEDLLACDDVGVCYEQAVCRRHSDGYCAWEENELISLCLRGGV